MTEHDCGCQSAERIADFLHNGLCHEDSADIRKHIENCPECQDKEYLETMLTTVIKRSCQEVAPEELRASILTKLRSAQSQH